MILASFVRRVVSELQALYDLIPYPRRSGLTRFGKYALYTVAAAGLAVASGSLTVDQAAQSVYVAAVGAAVAGLEKWRKEAGIQNEFLESDVTTDAVEA